MYRRNSQANVFNSNDNLPNGNNNGTGDNSVGNQESNGGNAAESGVEMMDVKQEPSSDATAHGNDIDMNSDSQGLENSHPGATQQQIQQRKMMMSNPNGGIGPNGDPYEFSEDGKNGSKQVNLLP